MNEENGCLECKSGRVFVKGQESPCICQIGKIGSKRPIQFLLKKSRAKLDQYPVDVSRPTKRSECPEERPCPFVSCRYNTYLEVTSDVKREKITINHPDLQPWEVLPEDSCALDLADECQSLERVGRVLGITRERVRQIECDILKKTGLKMLRSGMLSEEDPADLDRFRQSCKENAKRMVRADQCKRAYGVCCKKVHENE